MARIDIPGTGFWGNIATYLNSMFTELYEGVVGNNTFYGESAGESVTTGENNTGIGYEALKDLTTGSDNVVVGTGITSAAERSILLGKNIAGAVIDGSTPSAMDTIAIGVNLSYVGEQDTTGIADQLTASGMPPIAGYADWYSAPYGIAGQQCVDLGFSNHSFAIQRVNDICIGVQNELAMVMGSQNIAIGTQCLANCITSQNNIAIGTQCGVISGMAAAQGNLWMGRQTGGVSNGLNNLAFGTQCGVLDGTDFSGDEPVMLPSDSAFNIALGTQCGLNSSPFIDDVQAAATGENNISLGVQCGSFTSGDENIALGTRVMTANTTGNGNVAIGLDTLNQNTTGSGNVAIGYHAGLGLVTGNYNIMIGAMGSGFPADTNNNVVICDGEGNLRIHIEETGNVGIGNNIASPATAKLQVTGTVKFDGLPTADPVDAGALWNNSGVLSISAG